MTIAEQIALEKKMDRLLELAERQEALLQRFLPLLEKYERASNANSIFQARRAMKGA